MILIVCFVYIIYNFIVNVPLCSLVYCNLGYTLTIVVLMVSSKTAKVFIVE